MRPYNHTMLVSRAKRVMNVKYKEYQGSYQPKQRRLLGFLTVKDYFPNITKIPAGLSLLRSRAGWALTTSKWSVNLLKLEGRWKLSKTKTPDDPYWELMFRQAPTSFDDCDRTDPILTHEQAMQMVFASTVFEYDAKADFASDIIPIKPATDTVDIDGQPFKKKT